MALFFDNFVTGEINTRYTVCIITLVYKCSYFKQTLTHSVLDAFVKASYFFAETGSLSMIVGVVVGGAVLVLIIVAILKLRR